SDALSASMVAFVEYAEATARGRMQAYAASGTAFGCIRAGALGFALIILGLNYIGLRKLIIEPLGAAVESLGGIARADLSEEVPDMGRNEIGQLFAAMRSMQESLGRIVVDVRGGSDSIHTGASEI